MSSNQPKEYTHFEMYYLKYKDSFCKPADSLVLFIHWCMIQNKFKCLVDAVQTEALPIKWNLCKEMYDLFYQRAEIKYRLEIYLIQNLMHIQMKRLTDLYDSLLNVHINDYVNETFDCIPYTNTFKCLDKLHSKVSKFLSCTKDSLQNCSLNLTESSSTNSRGSSKANSVCGDVRIEDIETQPICAMVFDSQEIVLEENTFKVTETTEETTIIKDSEKKIQYAEYKKNMDRWHIKLDDCMKTTFKDYKLPIKLTDEMKFNLNVHQSSLFELFKTPSANPERNQTIRKKNRKVQQNISNQKLDAFVTKLDVKADTRKRKASSLLEHKEFSTEQDDECIYVVDDSPPKHQISNYQETAECPELQDKVKLKLYDTSFVDETILQEKNFFDKIGLRKISDQSNKETLTSINSNDNEILEITSDGNENDKVHGKKYQRKINDLNDLNKENFFI